MFLRSVDAALCPLCDDLRRREARAFRMPAAKY